MSDAHSPTPTIDCRADALQAIERLLNERPDSLDATLILATRCLVRYRDETIERLRENAGDPHAQRELAQANGTLSLLFGTHYPVIGLAWERLKKARDALAELTDAEVR